MKIHITGICSLCLCLQLQAAFAQTQPVQAAQPVASPMASQPGGPSIDLGLADSSQQGAASAQSLSATAPTPGTVVATAAPTLQQPLPHTQLPQNKSATAADRVNSPATVPAQKRPKVKSVDSAKDQLTSAHANDAAASKGRLERVQFNRKPVRVALSTSTERLITFPNPVSFSMPAGIANVLAIEVIDRTAYVIAHAPFPKMRVLAEDLVTGQVVPLDLIAEATRSKLTGDVEIFYTHEGQSGASPNGGLSAEAEETPLDMVALTRFAAQSIYAPRRLMPANSAVYSIPVDAKGIPGLFRGMRTSAVPMGQWRSGDLYVAAVRVTNLEKGPIDLDLDQVRGNWIAATLQHRRLHRAGSDLDTTTVYLVCGQPFQTCK